MDLTARITALAGAVRDKINLLTTGKQDTLVSGTNIKTINGSSILGSGNITVSGGGATMPDFGKNWAVNNKFNL